MILWYRFGVWFHLPPPQGGEPSLCDRPPPPLGGAGPTKAGRFQGGGSCVISAAGLHLGPNPVPLRTLRLLNAQGRAARLHQGGVRHVAGLVRHKDRCKGVHGERLLPRLRQLRGHGLPRSPKPSPAPVRDRRGRAPGCLSVLAGPRCCQGAGAACAAREGVAGEPQESAQAWGIAVPFLRLRCAVPRPFLQFVAPFLHRSSSARGTVPQSEFCSTTQHLLGGGWGGGLTPPTHPPSDLPSS